MKKQPLEAGLLEDSHIFLRPVLYRLLELLAEKPMHISELGRELGEERRLVKYHLAKLEERRFVTSKYKLGFVIKQKGKAFRVYTVTDKIVDVKWRLEKIFHSSKKK
jgi:predicted ArsR family transcriptional regulator